MTNLKYKKGNLVDAFINNEVNVLIHQANCFNTMGSGIAKEIKARLPKMFTADCETIKGNVGKLGSYSYAVFGVDNNLPKYGFNLYGQYRYGNDKQHTDYAAIKEGLISIREYIEITCPMGVVVGTSRLGCGLGGGSWEIVSKIIEEQLCAYDYEVICYEL